MQEAIGSTPLPKFKKNNVPVQKAKAVVLGSLFCYSSTAQDCQSLLKLSLS